MPIDLIIQYCGSKNEARQQEFNECLRRNLKNPSIHSIHNLVDQPVELPEFAKNSPKFHSHPLNRWMTFRDIFNFANEHLQGRFVGVCNLDIFLDDRESNWDEAERLVRERNLVLCQSRIEFESDEKKYLDPAFSRLAFANAQDAWFFVPPIEITNVNFEIGTMGCDNAIADRFKKAGRIPVNMGGRYKIYHYDICRGKTGQITNQFHKKDRDSRGAVYSRFPEREGTYLTPEMDMVPSIDELVRMLQLDPIRRYQIISDLMTEKIRIIN